MPSAARLSRLALLALVAACSRAPAAPQPAPEHTPTPAVAPPATPTAPAAPAPTPAAAPATASELAGEWTFTIEIGMQSLNGSMTLVAAGQGGALGGQVVPEGMSAGTVRSVTITGSRVTMVVDAPDGNEAIVEATLTADRRAMSGTLAYQGEVGSFSARRR